MNGHRHLAVLIAALSVGVSDPAGAGYTFSISASGTDPWENAGVPTGGPRDLYLWLVCGDDGVSAFEARLGGSFEPLGFNPGPGVMNIGTATSLMLAVGGCPDSTVVLGSWTVVDTTGGHACLVPTIDGAGSIVAVACAGGDVVQFPRVHGFSSDTISPCQIGVSPCLSGVNSPPGLVLGFETEVLPPYEFTGLGTEALLLNGYQYYPRPRQDAPGDPPVPTPEITALVAQMSALEHAVRDSVQHIPDLGARLAAAAALFEQAPLVERVVLNLEREKLAIYYFELVGPTNVTYLFEQAASQPDAGPGGGTLDRGAGQPLALHDALIQEFLHVMNLGGTVAFGDAYFVLSGDPGMASRTRALLAGELHRGEPVPVGSTILRVPLVRDAFEARGVVFDD